MVDERIFRKTCVCHPLEWWKCVDSREIKAPRASRWIVSEKAFLAWVYRLESLMHARECVIDNLSYDREIMAKNSKILSKVLSDVAGGREFLSVLPADIMQRLKLIQRNGNRCTGKRIETVENTAIVEFDEELAFPRDNEEVVWWMKRAFTRANIVVFLCPNGRVKIGVPVSLVRSSDDIAKILPEILEKTCTCSEAVDHVAFSARCDNLELKNIGNHMILSRHQFRTLLKDVDRVLIGVHKGMAWAEIPVGKVERLTRMPVFAKS